HLEPSTAALATRSIGRVVEVLELRKHEARHDEGALDEPAAHDVGDAPVDDHGGVEKDARVDAAHASLSAHALGERAELAPLDDPGGGADETEDQRGHEGRVAP